MQVCFFGLKKWLILIQCWSILNEVQMFSINQKCTKVHLTSQRRLTHTCCALKCHFSNPMNAFLQFYFQIDGDNSIVSELLTREIEVVNYFSKRYLSFLVNGYVFPPQRITSKVWQGCVLSPSLLLKFINDILPVLCIN